MRVENLPTNCNFDDYFERAIAKATGTTIPKRSLIRQLTISPSFVESVKILRQAINKEGDPNNLLLETRMQKVTELEELSKAQIAARFLVRPSYSDDSVAKVLVASRLNNTG